MGLRSQAAMEYLMTYGWALLAIMIVVIALFQLGILNGSNVAAHSTAGACQAIHSAAGSSLAGQCNNEWPKFVAQFNGANSYVNVGGTVPQLSSFTIAGWIEFNTNTAWMMIDRGTAATAGSYYIYGDYVSSGSGNEPDCTIFGPTGSRYDIFFGTLSTGTWYFLTCTFNSQTGTVQTYVDAAPIQSETAAALGTSTSITQIGNYAGGGYNLNGRLADLQLYNASLSQSEVTALYQEGIGAVPIDPAHLVGWWPLNGNTQDYSGNNDQGIATAVAYNSTWSSGYVQP